MAFNMKRPVIKGSVSHKTSIAKAKTKESIVSQRSTSADANLVNAARALGESYKPREVDYNLDPVEINLNKKEKAKKNEELAKEEEALTLASKNFQLKPINIDSQDLRLKKATRNLSDPKVNISKEEMEVIKKAEEDKRRAKDPLLSEINDRRELKKVGPDNVDPLTREMSYQSDRQHPDYTPEYRKTVEASKVDSINAQLLPSNSDSKLEKADMPSQKKTKLAHENPKYAIKKDIEGQSLDLTNERKNTGYSYDYENDQWSFNNIPITESEVRPADFKGIMTQVNKRRQLESNTPQQYPNTSNPIQKRDDGIWKRAIKGGKVHKGMRKSGYIPPEER